ncbi:MULTISPECIES: hypothetical protein [Pseudoalteromonas]|uniref:hypothetical protein n=1 Tax=Pseudoalteromonas TaxID=53246 RepID=UPI00249C9843|nr:MULTISPECIES: hypothetical protein [Pseudoalteromonas]MDI3246897.1 hypothetical protein [Pseudoalteromonas agarivorans]WRU71755.1 hypothetical protein VOI46_09440 [Pseudoalteromonas sp. CuT 4-3]
MKDLISLSDFNWLTQLATFIASIATILALVIAMWTLFNWRKHQLYLERIKLLTEMELSFQLLSSEYLDMTKNSFALIDRARNEKDHERIIKDLDDILNYSKFNEYSLEYQLSYLKCNRLIFNEKSKLKSFEDMENFYGKCVELRQELAGKEKSFDTVTKEFANFYSKFRKDEQKVYDDLFKEFK